MPEGVQAGGDISPKRIVRLSSAAGNNKVIQASAATAPLYGISGQGTRYMEITGLSLNDGLHAKSGENCKVFGIGEFAPCTAGGTIVAGDLITSDASAKAIAATGDAQHFVGEAMYGAVAGEDVLIRIRPGQRAN